MINARQAEHRLVAELVEHGVAEDVTEERGDQRVARLAAGAVAHGDRVLAQRRLALADLGDPLEHALLGVGDPRSGGLDGRAAPWLDRGLAHPARTSIGVIAGAA